MNTAIEIELRAVLDKLCTDDLHKAASMLLGRLHDAAEDPDTEALQAASMDMRFNSLPPGEYDG